jgi:hypothetical protein
MVTGRPHIYPGLLWTAEKSSPMIYRIHNGKLPWGVEGGGIRKFLNCTFLSVQTAIFVREREGKNTLERTRSIEFVRYVIFACRGKES